MANKGTQGLFKSDVNLVKEILGDAVSISVSTTDISGVKKLDLPLCEVLPSIIDIPYEKADEVAKRQSFTRDTFRYKIFSGYFFFIMFFQAMFSILSAIIIKIGGRGIYRHDVLNRIYQSDLVISGSDEIYKETASLLSFNFIWMITWWTLLFSKTWDVLISKFFNKPVIMFPNSVGPFRTTIGKFMAKTALNKYDYVFIREKISYDIVDSLDIKGVKILTSDTALLLPPKTLKNYSVAGQNIGVCPGVYAGGMEDNKLDEYILSHAKSLDNIIKNYDVNVHFIPHYIRGFSNDDLDTSKKIIDAMKYKDKTHLTIIDNVDDFKNLLIKMDVVISSKMHPAVFAVSEFTPTLCIAYDHKQIGFFEVLDMSKCLISIQEISYLEFWNKLEYVWENRDLIRKKLSEVIPHMKKNQKMKVEQVLVKYFPFHEK
jgi:colanic acid/amylovoran biosynthesis protein